MNKLNRANRHQAAPFFEHTDLPSVVLTFLQGYAGEGWIDCVDAPSCAQIHVGDISLVAGDHKSKQALSLVENLPDQPESPWFMIVPQNHDWAMLIEECFPEQSQKIVRHASKKDVAFSKENLLAYVHNLPSEYRLCKIDDHLFHRCLQNQHMRDLCSQFSSAQDYAKRGVGFCILHQDRIICGASSYFSYDGGIEIQIDTDKNYRRQGLATVCGARLILECLRTGRHPGWDAANLPSVALAEKLGYEFSHEYAAYLIRNPKHTCLP